LSLRGGSTQRCTDKIEHGCTTTNIPLSNDDTKIVSVLQRFYGKLAFTNFVIRKRDRITKKQTSNFCPHAAR